MCCCAWLRVVRLANVVEAALLMLVHAAADRNPCVLERTIGMKNSRNRLAVTFSTNYPVPVLLSPSDRVIEATSLCTNRIARGWIYAALSVFG